MEEVNLVKIEPPCGERTSEIVAAEILALIRGEYCYHTAALCRLLHCERQWVDAFVRPQVRHIFVTYFFRRYIAEHSPDLLAPEEQKLMHGFYFFSRQSLAAFWQSCAFAERKTVLIDLADYRRAGVSCAQLRSEYHRYESHKGSASEKRRHLTAMQKLLSPDGFALYCRTVSEKKVWTPCALPPWSESLRLFTAAEYAAQNGLHSGSATMLKLFSRGAIRIKLGARALWLLPEQKDRYYPLAVQAEECESGK